MYTHHKVDHEFPAGVPTHRSYMVCSVPRCGKLPALRAALQHRGRRRAHGVLRSRADGPVPGALAAHRRGPSTSPACWSARPARTACSASRSTGSSSRRCSATPTRRTCSRACATSTSTARTSCGRRCLGCGRCRPTSGPRPTRPVGRRSSTAEQIDFYADLIRAAGSSWEEFFDRHGRSHRTGCLTSASCRRRARPCEDTLRYLGLDGGAHPGAVPLTLEQQADGLHGGVGCPLPRSPERR